MRVIVPLQGVVQGRGGLVLGSVIPCALFYLLQLYFKRHRSEPTPPPQKLTEVSELNRSLSRTHLPARGSSAPACVSTRANSIVKSSDSPFYVGLKRVSEDPYDELSNPEGVIQLGLAENKVSVVWLWVEWIASIDVFLVLLIAVSFFNGCSCHWTWLETGLQRMQRIGY